METCACHSGFVSFSEIAVGSEFTFQKGRVAHGWQADKHDKGKEVFVKKNATSYEQTEKYENLPYKLTGFFCCCCTKAVWVAPV